MAVKKTYALNLGMQTVAMAEFEHLADGGLALAGYREYELMPDPAADATRLEQIKVAVGELRSGLNLPKMLRAYFCLPSQSVFTRFLRLPGSTAEDVRSVIGFEAQQNVPFPIAEVVWDYQILGAVRDANWDVALVAIKTDQLEEIYASCEQAGVLAYGIDISPMA
ncbi:MAG: pilus assembly protein PilM, partial [Chthoniobacterales bacterium]|nr:pilus assembly protein PilM [Chthoniobacterales bacterium]